ncbi:MAG: transcription elongation factor GreA [Bacteroidota bacterium]
MAKSSYYTEEGLQRLKEELSKLKVQERPRVAEQLADARDKGDLSENAEYEAAKEAQGLLEHRIAKLEAVVAGARVIAKQEINTTSVSILAKVKIKRKKNGDEVTYMLVSEEEADLKAGKVSIDSPLGQGLLGKKVGETAVVEAPAGKFEFVILNISL